MQNNQSKKLLIELSIYTVLFGLCFVSPVSIFYENYSMRAIPRYLPDVPLIYISVALFAAILLSIISKIKAIIHTTNALAIFLTLVLYLLMNLGRTWSGGHFPPDIGYGYYLSQLSLTILIIRSYSLLERINEYDFNQRVSRISGIAAITISSVLAFLFLLTLTNP